MGKVANIAGPAQSDVIRKNLAQINRANFMVRSVHNPIRQQIISLLLSNGKCAVQELCKKMKVEQSIMSQHLGVLREADLVTFKRAGKHIFYSANKANLKELVDNVRKVASI